MDYDMYLDEVEKLDFIKGREMADAAVKAVLGMFAGMLERPQAKRIAARLPEPLTFDKLVGHRKTENYITGKEFIAEIATLFKLDSDQARTLITTVFNITKDIVGDEAMLRVRESLPADWPSVIKKAA